MFNIEAVCESVKRHWIVIALITLTLLAVGAGSSLLKEGKAAVESTYTAEATLYVNGYKESEDVLSYNYRTNDDMLNTDARRVVVSNEVAGEVRRQLGEEVTITSPYWVNQKTNGNFYTRFIFVDAAAPSPELALEAAELAAQKALEVIKDTLPVSEASLSSEAVLKSSSEERASDFGVDAFPKEEEAPVAAVASSISVKNLVIFGFVGLVGSVIVFAAYDILSRRVRSARDIERLLAVPPLATLQGEQDAAFMAEDVKVLLKRNGLGSLGVAGCVPGDGAEEAAQLLSAQGLEVTCSVSAAVEPDAVELMAQAESLVVVLRSAAAKGSDIDRLLEALKVSGTPVLGAVFVPRKRL